MALSVVAAAAIGAFVFFAFAWRPNRRSDLERLVEAVGPHRVTLARLTGGFAYAPCDTAAGPDDSLVVGLTCAHSSPREWPEARRLGRLAQTLHRGGSGPGSLRRAIASWSIVWGKPDDAIEALHQATPGDPASAELQSDLAAALLQRAAVNQDPVAILDAYDAADSALALRPHLPEALFNRAVALEHLYLQADAIEAWSAYLKVDDQSPWAAEARAHLAALRTPPPSWTDAREGLRRAVTAGDDGEVERIVRRYPWQVRQQLHGTVIAWARAYAAGTTARTALVAQMLTLGEALRATTGDTEYAGIAHHIAAAEDARDRARLDATARGLIAYERGHAESERLALGSAEVMSERARRELEAARSPAVFWPLYELARVSYQRLTSAGYEDAVRRFRQITASAPDEYRSLRGLATRNIGFVEFIRANYDAAHLAFTKAIRDGRAIGDPVLELRTATDAAMLGSMLRGEPGAWVTLYEAFRASHKYRDAPRDRQRLFSVAASLSWKRSPSVAPLFQREAVRLAGVVNDSLLLVGALTGEAELLGRRARQADALERLNEARAYAVAIERDSTREVMLADVDRVYGEVLLRDRPDSAVRVLKRVVERYGDTGYEVQAARARLLLAAAYAGRGQVDSARLAFEDAIAKTESQRAALTTFEDRTSFLDQARPVIDTVVQLRIAVGDTIGALDFLECVRARVLLERASRGTSAANSACRPVSETRRTLAPGTVIVSFAVMDNGVVSWAIRRDGVSMARTPLDGGIRPLVERFTALVRRGNDPELRAVAGRLYTLLIAPIEDAIPPAGRLVIVPDQSLHFVPFAALFDERRGRFLVQSHEVAVAPSVRLFADATSRYRATAARRAPAVLVVGNPSFDRAVYALPMLPGAEREADSVAALYSHARLLTGTAATRQAFLDRAASANIIHFAGHGVISPHAPMLSQLVLAPDANASDGGGLYAKDLFTLKLPNTRLAILSGCHTASGEISGTEGASSLARALFAAGVPAVIASLWAVDDEATAQFFTRFHRELARDGDPGAALRRTQVEWLSRSSDGWSSLSTWAAFQLFGATGG